MPDFDMPLMHMEGNAKEPTEAANVRSDDQNHKSSAHRQLQKHLSETEIEKVPLHYICRCRIQRGIADKL